MNSKIESALVGSLLVAPEKIIAVADRVKPTDFQDVKAQTAYSAIVGEWRQRKPVDVISIAAVIPELAVYLAKSTNDAFPPSIKNFAHEIAESARERRIRAGLEAAAISGAKPDNMLSDIMKIYQHELSPGKKSADISAVLGRVDKIVQKNKANGRLGFQTGISFLENLYVRYVPGHIWTVGGFTSVGKTATMVQMICNLLSLGEGAKILVVSTEMTEEQVVARIVANFTGVHSMRILSSSFHNAEEENTVETVKESLRKSQLTIYDDIYRLEEIETVFRKADLQGGVNVGFIDYVQNCKWPEAKSQYQEQSEMAKRFQVLAKDVRATLVCLSQVSNDVGRGNTDQLELKGAGEWAAVSDLGVMLARHKTEKHRLKFSVKKNRHGALSEIEMEYKDNFTRLEERLI